MRAKLTVVYEREIEADEVVYIKDIVNEGDAQAYEEYFGIGWDVPEDVRIEFE